MDSAGWDERYAGDELVWKAEPNRFLVAETTGLTPGRALDLACGEGRNAAWLASRGWDTTGVDFSSVGLTKAARLANLTDGHGGPQDPTLLLSTDDVRNDLTGLLIQRAEQVRRLVDTDNGTTTAIDTLVRATRTTSPTQGAS